MWWQQACRALGSVACVLVAGIGTSAHAQTQGAASADSVIEIVVHKSPTCGCCDNWIDHLRHHGFRVTARNEADMRTVKATHKLPPNLSSCHTAIVGGYIIEGHVPADVILRLLKERPDIAGLAVPGMPLGSPGMEVSGREPSPYDIIAFTKSGKTTVYEKR